MRIFLESVTFFVLLEPRNIYCLQRRFHRTILFTKYVVLPAAIHFYTQKQVKTPSLYTHARQDFKNCRMAIAYKLEVRFYITCLINDFEF